MVVGVVPPADPFGAVYSHSSNTNSPTTDVSLCVFAKHRKPWHVWQPPDIKVEVGRKLENPWMQRWWKWHLIKAPMLSRQTCVISLFLLFCRSLSPTPQILPCPFLPCSSGSSALPNNMAYFGSSQEEEDLEEEEDEEEEDVRNGGGVHSHGGASSSQTPASSSCHSTPRKGKIPSRQPLNGHGKGGSRALLSLTPTLSRDIVFPTPFLHMLGAVFRVWQTVFSWYNGPTHLCLLPERKTKTKDMRDRSAV